MTPIVMLSLSKHGQGHHGAVTAAATLRQAQGDTVGQAQGDTVGQLTVTLWDKLTMTLWDERGFAPRDVLTVALTEHG